MLGALRYPEPNHFQMLHRHIQVAIFAVDPLPMYHQYCIWLVVLGILHLLRLDLSRKSVHRMLERCFRENVLLCS